MNNQTILIAIITLCSLGGWYVVINKYLDMKALLRKNKSVKLQKNFRSEEFSQVGMTLPPIDDSNTYMDDIEYVPGEHVPGMGPPSLMPYRVPEEVINSLKKRDRETRQSIMSDNHKSPDGTAQNATQNKVVSTPVNNTKRDVCHWASVMHLSGLAFIFGVPFLNIIAPTILWLLKKEQHPYLARQGREIINFQITLTLIQFLCLGLGVMAIWLFPNFVASILALTKTLRIVFSSSMHLPFNMFTALPFFWGSVMVLRGTIAAYHGIGFKYPYAQPFVFDGKTVDINTATEQVMTRKEPQLHTPTEQASYNKISFG